MTRSSPCSAHRRSQAPKSFMLQKPLFICQVSAELLSKLCIHDTSSRDGRRELASQRGREITKRPKLYERSNLLVRQNAFAPCTFCVSITWRKVT